MGTFSSQVRLGLTLAIRNRMALIYGFFFPLIFLVAYWGLYRHDEVPIALHLGELLTVTILGGACFGLPTTLVSERERGVWRRYRLTPAPLWLLIASALATRFILVLAAALLQICLALALGMPLPAHPFGLLAAFTLTALAFMGLGLVIAALAGNVPTVQALGQCIFLPMLIVGGVAVRLPTLPAWALHTSAFFPGRYAVAALQTNVTGNGFAVTGFDLLALALIGAAAMIAGLRIFRWDADKRRASRGDRLWLALALGVWALVGILAEQQGRVSVEEAVLENVGTSRDFVVAEVPAAPPQARSAKSAETPVPAPESTAVVPASSPAPAPSGPADWHLAGPQDFKKIAFERLPPDSGLVAPIATADEAPDPLALEHLERVRQGLETWAPAQVADPVQRARNDLYVAGVPDLLQMSDVERFLPQIVFDQLRKDISAEDLPKVLYWVAMHPDGGSDEAIDDLEELGLPGVMGPRKAARARVMLYAFKFLGRLIGDLPAAS